MVFWPVMKENLTGTSLPLVHNSTQRINIKPCWDKARWLSALCGVCNTTRCYGWFTQCEWIITQQFTLIAFIHKLRHLSCKRWHTPHYINLLLKAATLSVFTCWSKEMTQVSLISVFISLLPTVIRSPSCLLSLSFVHPHLFYLRPVILLSHPALLNSL